MKKGAPVTPDGNQPELHDDLDKEGEDETSLRARKQEEQEHDLADEDILDQPLESDVEDAGDGPETESLHGKGIYDEVNTSWRETSDIMSDASEGEEDDGDDDKEAIPAPIEAEEEGQLRRRLLDEEGYPKTSDAFLAIKLKLTGLEGRIPVKIDRPPDFISDEQREAILKSIRAQLKDIERRWALTRPPLKAFATNESWPSFDTVMQNARKRKRSVVLFKYRAESFKRPRLDPPNMFSEDGVSDVEEEEDDDKAVDCPEEPFCPLEFVGPPVSVGFLSIILKRTGMEPRSISNRASLARKVSARCVAGTNPAVSSSHRERESGAIKTRELREIKSSLEMILEETERDGRRESLRDIVLALADGAVKSAEEDKARVESGLLVKTLIAGLVDDAVNSISESHNLARVSKLPLCVSSAASQTDPATSDHGDKVAIFQIPSWEGLDVMTRIKVWVSRNYPNLRSLEVLSPSAVCVDLGSTEENEKMIREMPKGKPMDCKFMTKILSCRWLSAVGAEELNGYAPRQMPNLDPIGAVLLEILRNDVALVNERDNHECCECCGNRKRYGRYCPVHNLANVTDGKRLEEKRFDLKQAFQEKLTAFVGTVTQSDTPMEKKVSTLRRLTTVTMDVVNELQLDRSSIEPPNDDYGSEDCYDFGQLNEDERYLKDILDDAIAAFLLPLSIDGESCEKLRDLLRGKNEDGAEGGDFQVIKTCLSIWTEPLILQALSGEISWAECLKFSRFLPLMLPVLENRARYREALNLAETLAEDARALKLCLKLDNIERAVKIILGKSGIQTEDLVRASQIIVESSSTDLSKFEIGLACLKRYGKNTWRASYDGFSPLMAPLIHLVLDTPMGRGHLDFAVEIVKRNERGYGSRVPDSAWQMLTVQARSLAESEERQSGLSQLAITAITQFSTMEEFLQIVREKKVSQGKKFNLILRGMWAYKTRLVEDQACQEFCWKILSEGGLVLAETDQDKKIIQDVSELITAMTAMKSSVQEKIWQDCICLPSGQQSPLKIAITRCLFEARFVKLSQSGGDLESLLDLSLADKALIEIAIAVVAAQVETRQAVPPKIFFTRMSEAIDIFPEVKEVVGKLLMKLIEGPNGHSFMNEALPFCDELMYTELLEIATKKCKVAEVQDFVLSSYTHACTEFPGLKRNGMLDLVCKMFFKAAPGKFLELMMAEAGESACEEAIKIVTEVVANPTADFRDIQDCIDTLIRSEERKEKGILLLKRCFFAAPWQFFVPLAAQGIIHDPNQALLALRRALSHEATIYNKARFGEVLKKIDENLEAWSEHDNGIPNVHFKLVETLFMRHPSDFLVVTCPLIDRDVRADALATSIMDKIESDRRWAGDSLGDVLDHILRKVKRFPAVLAKMTHLVMRLFFRNPRDFLVHVVTFLASTEVTKAIAFFHDDYFDSLMASRDPEFFISVLLVGAFDKFSDTRVPIMHLVLKVLRSGEYNAKMAMTILKSAAVTSDEARFQECLNCLGARRESRASVEAIEYLCSALIALCCKHSHLVHAVSGFLRVGADDLNGEQTRLKSSIESSGSQWRRNEREVPGCRSCKVECAGRQRLVQFLASNEQKQSLTGNAVIRKCITRLLTSTALSRSSTTLQKHLSLESREVTADENMRLFGTRRCGGIVVTKHRVISKDDKHKTERMTERITKWTLYVGKVEGIMASRVAPSASSLTSASHRPEQRTSPPRGQPLSLSSSSSLGKGIRDNVIILTPPTISKSRNNNSKPVQ